jgi:hypothetical protein
MVGYLSWAIRMGSWQALLEKGRNIKHPNRKRRREIIVTC